MVVLIYFDGTSAGCIDIFRRHVSWLYRYTLMARQLAVLIYFSKARQLVVLIYLEGTSAGCIDIF